jgi:hypothetical protein
MRRWNRVLLKLGTYWAMCPIGPFINLVIGHVSFHDANLQAVWRDTLTV